MSRDRSNTNLWKKPDPGFEPFDADARARDLEQNDQFNRLVDEAIPVKGGLKSQLEKIAASGNSEVIAILEENGIDDPRVPRTFYLANGSPAKVFGDSTGWHVVFVSNGQELTFTNPDRDTCMAQASSYADRTREPRPLTDSERYRVSQLAQANPRQAIVEYLRYRLGDEELNKDERDPRHRHIYDQCAYDVWRFHKDTYVRDADFEQLLRQIAFEKPLTFVLIEAVHKEYVKTKSNQSSRQASPETEAVVTEDDLDQLSFAEVAKLRTAILQDRGRQVRALDRRFGL